MLGRSQVGLVLKSVKGILCSDKHSMDKSESQKSDLGGHGWTLAGINPIACGFVPCTLLGERRALSFHDLIL